MKRIVLLFLILPLFVKAQRDTEFWFAAPDIDATQDRPILLRITTYSSSATVTITIPANNSFTPLSSALAANATTTIDLTAWITLIENETANTTLNKGLRIISTADISVYYEVISTQQFVSTAVILSFLH